MSFAIKQGTRNPSMTINVDGDLTGITFTAIRWRLATGVPGSAVVGTVGNLTLISATSAKSVVQYDWAAGETGTVGQFEGEVEGTIGGLAAIVPGAGFFRFTVTPKLA